MVQEQVRRLFGRENERTGQCWLGRGGEGSNALVGRGGRRKKVRRVMMWTVDRCASSVDEGRTWKQRKSFPASGNRSRHPRSALCTRPGTWQQELAATWSCQGGMWMDRDRDLGCLADEEQGIYDLDRRSVVCWVSLIDPPGARRCTGKRNEQGSALVVIKRGVNK